MQVADRIARPRKAVVHIVLKSLEIKLFAGRQLSSPLPHRARKSIAPPFMQ